MNRERAGFVGAIFVIALLAIHSVERWTVVDAVLNGIRSWGPIGIGIAGFLTSPVVPLALSLATIALYLEGMRERMSNDAELKPSIDNSPTQTQSTGAVTQQVIVNNTPHSTSQLSPQPSTEEPKRSPNLRCLGATTSYLREGHEGGRFYDDPQRRFSESVLGAFACFRNEAEEGKDVASAFGVRASLTFLDQSGHEMGTGIAEACWLGDLRPINFRIEESHCVIVLLLLPNGTIVCPYREHVTTSWGGGLRIETYQLSELPLIIEVRLIVKNDLVSPICEFQVSMENGRPVLKQRVQGASYGAAKTSTSGLAIGQHGLDHHPAIAGKRWVAAHERSRPDR